VKQYLKIALEDYFQDENKEAFCQALEDVAKAKVENIKTC
jgi:hypothetical protein